MRRSSLPNVKDNLVVSRSNLGYTHSPNVSRSWESHDVVARVRTEERLARSFGDRGQEKKVLDWCKKHNVNVIRKLPKLDPTILTSRGMNAERFTSFVDEVKMVERERPVKPQDYSKERILSAKRRENFCEFCQREMPKKRRRRNRTFFTSPYECEHCGASNDINSDSDQNVSESESEDSPAVSESVSDTIRWGNPKQVIDHRTFSENEKISDNSSEKIQGGGEDDESDIFWRNDFDTFHGNFEEKMNLNDTNEDCYDGTVFLTETTVVHPNNKPVEVKMAWDDDSSNQFAEISRTIATDDGIEVNDHASQETFDSIADVVSSKESTSPTTDSFEESESNSENVEGTILFPESDSTYRLSPTPPSHHRRGRSPRNFRYGEQHRRQSAGEVHINSMSEENTSESYEMTQSPIANRSIGLSRVALMRLSRQSRTKTRAARSSSTTAEFVVRIQEPRSHSCDPDDPYSFPEDFSPEIKSVHQNKPDSSDSRK